MALVGASLPASPSGPAGRTRNRVNEGGETFHGLLEAALNASPAARTRHRRTEESEELDRMLDGENPFGVPPPRDYFSE